MSSANAVVDPRRARASRSPATASSSATSRRTPVPDGTRSAPAGAAELEELALRAGPAIDNARRFREARQLADLDALTGLHNRRYFHETLAREVARAQRYSRSLALVVFDLDDFKAINDRIGHLAGDGVLAEAADRIRDVVRSADVACRVGGDEFAVILPESSLKDADQLYKRLEQAISHRPVAQAGRLHLSAGVTELRPDDDAISFFERADEALYRAKGAGKGTVVAIESPTPVAARGARNGIQLVSGTVPTVGRRSRTQRIWFERTLLLPLGPGRVALGAGDVPERAHDRRTRELVREQAERRRRIDAGTERPCRGCRGAAPRRTSPRTRPPPRR